MTRRTGHRARLDWLDRAYDGETVRTRILCGVGVALATVGLCAIGADMAQAAPPEHKASAPMLTMVACPSEDSGDCYWLASERGNGDGSSFLALVPTDLVGTGGPWDDSQVTVVPLP